MTMLRRWDGWLRHRPWVADLALAAAAALLALASVPLVTGFLPLAAIFVLHVSVAGRRVAPRLSFGVAALAEVALLFAPTVVPSSAVFLLLLYAVAAYVDPPAPVVALGIGVVGAVLITVRLAAPSSVLVGVALAAAVLAAWFLGRFRRIRDGHLAAQRTLHEEAAARRERNRIAGEIHDVVAHSLAVIVRQAEAGAYALDADPVAARRMLDAVASTGRDALNEMRGLVGVLRQDSESVVTDVPELIERVRGTGLAVEVEERGTPIPLDRARQLAVFRLVQEALTNVVKHVGVDATATVRIEWRSDGVRVEISNPGASRTDSPGYGLVGLRERLHLLGGTLESLADNGFTLRGWIPRE